MPIRPATPADIPAVLTLVRAMYDFHYATDPVQFALIPEFIPRHHFWLKQRVADPLSIFIVAEQDDLPLLAAYTVCTKWSVSIASGSCFEYGWIYDLYVIPAARQQGLARALIREVSARSTALGIKRLMLRIANVDDDARAAFAAEGFHFGVTDMVKFLV